MREERTIPTGPYGEGEGLAGPGSVAQRVNGERVLLLGWARAILLQLAHPLVAAGVADHSSFRAGPLQRVMRLRRTLDAMLAFTFGSGAEADRAAARINAIHDRVHGRLKEGTDRFPAGTPYSAHDPALLRWVHATLLDSLPPAYERYVGPLNRREKDRYCFEASGLGPLLGVPDGYLPTSIDALEEYMEAMLRSGEIAVTEPARTLARDLLSPPDPGPARPLLWLVRLHAVGLLPPSIREAYGFSWSARDEVALRRSTSMVRRMVRLTPAPVRRWPAARAGGRPGALVHLFERAANSPFSR